MYFLGIDGGGTKTSFTLINEKGNVIHKTTMGTCHYNQIGFEKLEILLKEGLDKVIKAANISKGDIAQSFIGLAGYGRIEEVRIKIEEVVKKAFEGVNYILGNDVQVAIAGALKGQDGINIVSGTGSIALALKDKELIRVGGFGPAIGDEGSAYWIGKKALQLFSKEVDGRAKKGCLYNIFIKELSLKDDYEIISYVNDRIKCDRGEIAKLSKLCSLAALEGDEEASLIFKEAGKELAEMVKVLLKNYGDEKVLVSYTGGVFKSGKLILEPIRENLMKYNVKLIDPILSPDLGACLLAYMNLGYEVSNELIENMNK